MSFASAFKRTLGHEGVYSDNPSDPGGKTKYGITERVARANGFSGNMKDLELVDAQSIARSQYWDALNLTPIDNLSPVVAEELFDTGYNMGISVAGKFLQRALNALNRGGKDFTDIEVDGIIGPMTISVLNNFLKFRGHQGEHVLFKILNVLQGARYLEIADKRESSEDFIFGWFQRVL